MKVLISPASRDSMAKLDFDRNIPGFPPWYQSNGHMRRRRSQYLFSQIDIIPPKDLNEYVGNVYEFKIVKVNDDRKNIVLSRREVIEQERAELRQKFLGEVQVGERDLHRFVRWPVIHEGNRCSIAETFAISGMSAGSGMTLVIAASTTSRK